MEVIKIFSVAEILPYLSSKFPNVRIRHYKSHGYNESINKKKRILIHGKEVTINTATLVLFKNKGTTCCYCGIKGEYFKLEKTVEDKYILKLYAVKGNDYILMTKDHIVSVSNGGKTELNNLQVMCEICNSRKGNSFI